MRTIAKRFLYLNIFLYIFSLIGVDVVNAAWNNPQNNPPIGSMPLPILDSSIGQIKEGGLILNPSSGNGLIIPSGRVGIGVLDPETRFDVNDAIRLVPRATEPFPCDSSKEGSMYFSSAYNIYVFCNGSFWTDYAGDAGPSGSRGGMGSQGAPGPQGPSGNQGPRGGLGPPGPPGPPGPAGLPSPVVQCDPSPTGPYSPNRPPCNPGGVCDPSPTAPYAPGFFPCPPPNSNPPPNNKPGQPPCQNGWIRNPQTGQCEPNIPNRPPTGPSRGR